LWREKILDDELTEQFVLDLFNFDWDRCFIGFEVPGERPKAHGRLD